MFLVAQYSVEGRGDGIICRPIGPICILVRVQSKWKSSLDVMHDQPLQTFRNYRCQCNGALIIEGCYGSLLWYWHWYCGCLQACCNNALQQRKVKDICKYLTQLCGTVPEDAPWDAIWTSRFLYVDFAESWYHFSRLDDEYLAVGGRNWFDSSLNPLHFEASEVLVELLRM